MNYTPTNSVWELTYACNMRCKHCGSGCGEKYPNELTTEEALALCDDLVEIGMKLITLSGGEPFMREDWPQIARRLALGGVTVNVISNGWFISKDLIRTAQEAGIVNIGISLDGLKETHDFIRRKGAFDHVMTALDNAAALKMPIAINTSINTKNLYELQKIKEILVEKKVIKWQFQIASPMGNLLENPELIITPDEVDILIDSVYDIMKEGKILPYLADDIGYYNTKEMEIRGQDSIQKNASCPWGGCYAGKRVLGIRANGDISGCLSIRDDNFTEGNIREFSLKEIWTRPGGFAWNREFTRDKLKGFCKTCQYAQRCLGGCSGAKLTLSNSLYENKYCSYRNKVEKEQKKMESINNYDELLQKARELITGTDYQSAHAYLSKALTLQPDSIAALDLLGFTSYSLGNYHESISYTNKALHQDKRHSYAYKIRGLSHAKSGQVQKGIGDLQQAIKYVKNNDYSDIYLNLAAILDDNNMTKDAVKILEQARKYSEKFREQSESMYQMLLTKLASQKADKKSRKFIGVEQLKNRK
ncbi:MAG: radical SAM protein [Spirochaetales bacterium]|nr:radical SAM protein [Spirochaetales bacterium]